MHQCVSQQLVTKALSINSYKLASSWFSLLNILQIALILAGEVIAS